MGKLLVWKVLEVYFVNCYLQGNEFKISGGVKCSTAPDVFQRNAQSTFNGQLIKVEKNKEVILGTCWEIGELNIMMCRFRTYLRIPSKTVSSSQCSTFTTHEFYVAIDTGHFINGRLTRLTQINEVSCEVTNWTVMQAYKRPL